MFSAFLIESGEVIEVGPDAVVLTRKFRAHEGENHRIHFHHGPTTVSELRQALGVRAVS